MNELKFRINLLDSDGFVRRGFYVDKKPSGILKIGKDFFYKREANISRNGEELQLVYEKAEIQEV